MYSNYQIAYKGNTKVITGIEIAKEELQGIADFLDGATFESTKESIYVNGYVCHWKDGYWEVFKVGYSEPDFDLDL